MSTGNGTQFTFKFGQRVRIRPPHPDAGATGEVMNAYLYRDNRVEKVFVSVPGGEGCYDVTQLEGIPDSPND